MSTRCEVPRAFRASSRSAQFQIGLPFAALKAHTFSSLFGIPISSLVDLFSGTLPTPKQLVLHNGVAVWCRVKIKAANPWNAGRPMPVTPQQAEEQAAATPSPAVAKVVPRKPHLSTLQYLDTGDPQVSAVIHKLRMVSGKDIPVMILGETGTGKDLLAQAIHGDSNRSGQPFVSVNCASIPDTLIESELFGYEEGAFTGENSATHAAAAGCTYALVGHSERRQYFGETDETVNKRAKAALAAGLVPVVCIGETLAERDGGQTELVLTRQLKGGLAGIANDARLVIAYEPVWAIGTGRVATTEQAEAAHVHIRNELRGLAGALADTLPIVYGGSVKPDNAKGLMSQPNIDGALVGGASLDAGQFFAIGEGF